MNNKINTIKERVLYVLDAKRIEKNEFFQKIGMPCENFTGKAKQTPLNSTAIGNILLEIPDLSPEWLLTGNKEMLKQQKAESTIPTIKNRNSLSGDHSKMNSDNAVINYKGLSKKELMTMIEERFQYLRKKEDQIEAIFDENRKLTDEVIRLNELIRKLLSKLSDT